MNLLAEFEKRYWGDASQTMAICEDIAIEFGLDTEEVADYVYLHRYEDDPETDNVVDFEEE